MLSKPRRAIRMILAQARTQGGRLWITASLITLLVVFSFSFGYFFRELSSSEFFQFPLVREAFYLLQSKGLKTMPDQTTLQYGMLHGLVQAYGDPFTVFVEPPQAELQTNQLEGKFGGIGVRIEQDSQGNILLYPLPDSPAQGAGVIEGDQLLGVNELLITSQTTLDQIQAAIRGPVGQKVKITITRAPDFQPIDVSVVRAEVPVPSVTYNLASFDSTISIVQLNLVADTSPNEIVNAVDQLQQSGATRLILDLRNNGGGLVDSGADVVRLFLSQGVFLQEQFKDQAVISFSASSAGTLANIPLVVVVNHNTASAAEIIAGALQSEGRALLVGSQTYGKDSVQQVFQLKDGSSLHVTAGRWWLPANQQGIGQVGLTPDRPLSEEESNSALALEEAARALPAP